MRSDFSLKKLCDSTSNGTDQCQKRFIKTADMFTNPTYCNVAILPVDTKDLPISPRFSPMSSYRVANSVLIHLVNQ